MIGLKICFGIVVNLKENIYHLLLFSCYAVFLDCAIYSSFATIMKWHYLSFLYQKIWHTNKAGKIRGKFIQIKIRSVFKMHFQIGSNKF